MISRRIALLAFVLSMGSMAPATRAADTPPARPDLVIDAATRTAVIEGVAQKIESRYVFPDIGKKIASSLRSRGAKTRYGGITSGAALCESLTAELRSISKDLHLRVDYAVQPKPMTKPDEEPTPEQVAAQKADFEWENYGFRKVERLAGNIGYLRIDRFAPPEYAGEKAFAAMAFLADTDALIIDLRQNGGGTPLMVALLASYLFDPTPVHLNSIYSRVDDETKQFWTFSYLPGPRYVGKDVYVLTSARTFSGAEEFAYDLKNLKRATIVGERTRGGAHPGGIEMITPHFGVMLPTGRAINPVTNTNWEGVGVEPDLAAPADSALAVAHRTALTKLIEKTKDTDRADWYRQSLQIVGN